MTGAAPIYLVSACTSGEEFVAAFRRYADKNGLFIPISEPLAIGRRARFAVTLSNGGVMIEGEAEVTSSARTASVLHGRVGMTLRFIAPDDASKTTLGELERARLAMKPAPPSMSPRPAEIPAEPRSIPPPVQGRIDAVNALAECVAIGDPEPPPPTPPPARSGLKTMTGMPPATGNQARSRSPSTPPSIPSPAAPPDSSGRSQTITTVTSPANRGPISDTFVTAMPPTPTELDLASPTAPRVATEMPVAVPRTPTKPGVAPAPAAPAARSSRPIAIAREPADSETMTAVPAPRPASPSAPTEIGGVIVDPAQSSDPVVQAVEAIAHDDMSARTQVHAGPPSPEPAAGSSPEPAVEPSAGRSSELALEPSSSLAGREAITAGAPPSGFELAPPIMAPDRVPEIEICEPTDLSVGPPEPMSTPSLPPEVVDLYLPDSDELVEAAGHLPPGVEHSLLDTEKTPPDEASFARPRKTVLGIAPMPRVAPLPAAAVIPVTPEIRKVVAAGAPATLPSGDWTIARDPDAPDGWSAPFATIPPHHLGDPRSPLPVPIVASTQPLESDPRRPMPRPDEMPMLEPKVQIDPTLIEPLQAMPPSESYAIAASPPGMPGYDAAPAALAVEAPPMNIMMAVAQPNLYMMPHGSPMHAPQPGYAMDHGYQMLGMAGPHEARYASDHAWRASSARRRAIIVLVSALVAVVIGIVVLLALRGHDGAPSPDTKPRESSQPVRPTSRANLRAGPPAPVASPDLRSQTNPDPPATTPDNPAAAVVTDPAAAPPPDSECFADVMSVPIGADIVIDQTNVIGTTPDRVALPCGSPIELLIRKGRLVPVTRMITPTPEGAKVKVTLARQTFLVKFNSTPPGATITLYGRLLGVTPTTVKVPAFETSTLTITKDGYAIATAKVAPKANGGAVHTTLTRLERARRR